MKTLFNIISIIVKIATIIMAIVGLISTIIVSIIGNVYVNHVYDVVGETDSVDPDDEDQDLALTTEAFSRTMADPRIKDSKFINAVGCGIGRFASFVANL